MDGSHLGGLFHHSLEVHMILISVAFLAFIVILWDFPALFWSLTAFSFVIYILLSQ